MSLLLLFAGAQSGAPPPPPPPALVVTPCCFQPNAFQKNAFQNCGFVGGWPNTLRRKTPRKILERLLKLQKDATFGRAWFAEFEATQQEFAKAEARAAAQIAAQEARAAAELVHEANIRHAREGRYQEHLRELALTLEVTRQVSNFKDVVAAAGHARAMALALQAQIYDEEDDIIAIMLLH